MFNFDSKYRILFGLLLFAGAASVGWKTSAPAHQRASPEISVSQRSRTLKAETPPGEAQLLASLPEEKERMRKAIEMAGDLPASEIRSWLESGKFSMSGGYSLTLFERIAFDRWALEDPADFMAWTLENQSRQYHRQLRIIVQNHPDLLSRVIDQNAGTPHHRQLLRTLATASPDFALAEFRRLLPELTGREFGYEAALSILMKERPEELLALFLDPAYAGNPELATVVLRHQLEVDFESALEILLARSDGYRLLFSNNNRNPAITPELLLARLPDFPEVWRDQLVSYPDRFRALLGNEIDVLGLDFSDYGFSKEKASRLRINLAALELERNPKEFLGRLGTLGFEPEVKQYLIESLAGQELSAREQAQLASALKDPADRLILEKAIADFRREYGPRSAPPANREELFAAITQEADQYPQLRLSAWDEAERARLEAEFDSLPPDQKSKISKLIHHNSFGPLSGLESKALVHLIAEEAINDPLKSQEFSSYNKGALEHVLELMNRDPGQAASWINQLPQGTIRLQAKKNLAINWRNYDPELTQNWIAAQPPAERKAIEEFLESK